MSYNPVNWVNGETPINDVNLNNMDQGISAAHEILAEHDEKIDDFANQQLPEEYVKSAVDEYVNENSGGFATATALAETKESLESKTSELSSEIVDVKEDLNTIIPQIKVERGTLDGDAEKKDSDVSLCSEWFTIDKRTFIYAINSVSEYKMIIYAKDSSGNITSVLNGNVVFTTLEDTNLQYRFIVRHNDATIVMTEQEYKNDIGISFLDETVFDIPLEIVQGSFDGIGENVVTNVRLRTQKIPVDYDSLYLFTFPSTIKCLVNYDYDNNRLNSTYQNSSFSIKGCKDFVRLSFKRENDSVISYEDLTTSEKKQIHIYKINSKSTKYDVTIATEKSFNRDKADIVVNGDNDQNILQGLISCWSSINIYLYGGVYHLKEFFKTNKSGQYACLHTSDIGLNYNEIVLHGEFGTRGIDNQGVKLQFDIEEDTMSNSIEYAGILVPRREVAENSLVLSNTILNLQNVTLIGCTYQKKIVYVDSTHANGNKLKNIMVRADGSTTGLAVFPTKPNVDCVGIRVGYGSNNGIQNYVKQCMCYYCGKGFSICGEHYIIEDCLAHHCYIGLAFGDRLTRGNYEHPNIMIGCSIEGCYRLMLLTRYGETEESDTENALNTLIVTGLSTEVKWDIPLDELVEGEQTYHRTLPIKEVINGNYRGRIEIDYPDIPFEDGSGKYMKYTYYNGTGSHSN